MLHPLSLAPHHTLGHRAVARDAMGNILGQRILSSFQLGPENSKRHRAVEASNGTYFETRPLPLSWKPRCRMGRHRRPPQMGYLLYVTPHPCHTRKSYHCYDRHHWRPPQNFFLAPLILTPGLNTTTMLPLEMFTRTTNINPATFGHDGSDYVIRIWDILLK